MTLIRKECAGGSSLGYEWPDDGAVVEVQPEHAEVLKAIPDGGFSEVLPEPEPDETDDDPEDPAGDEPPADAAAEAKPRTPRKAAVKKTVTE